MNYTYILQCKDGSLYTGWTNDIEKRLGDHRSGRGARYTKGRGPLELIYLEVSDSRSQAMRREAWIKHLTRQKKLILIQNSGWKEHLAEWVLENLQLQEQPAGEETISAAVRTESEKGEHTHVI